MNHFLTIRGLVSNDSSIESIIDALFKDDHKKKQNKLIDDLHKYHHSKIHPGVLDDIYRYHHKIKQSKVLDDIYWYHHKQNLKNLKQQIDRNLQKRQNNQIINELKILRRLNPSKLIKKENTSRSDLDEIERLSNLSIRILRKLAQLRNIETA